MQSKSETAVSGRYRADKICAIGYAYRHRESSPCLQNHPLRVMHTKLSLVLTPITSPTQILRSSHLERLLRSPGATLEPGLFPLFQQGVQLSSLHFLLGQELYRFTLGWFIIQPKPKPKPSANASASSSVSPTPSTSPTPSCGDVCVYP